MRDRLVENGQPVTHRSFGGMGHKRDRLALRSDAFLFNDLGKMPRQQVHRNTLQVEALAPRQHRHRHFLHLGRRKQEFDVRRRLFQRLQQRVEGVFGQHVHFVDDVNLVPRRHGGIAHRLDNLPHVVHTGMAGGVHLDHIDMPPLRDRAARFADTARADRRAALTVRTDAVERLGDQSCSRRLADPAHAGHQKGMGQPVALDRVGQRLHHRILADQRIETLRPIFTRQHPVGRVRGGHRFGHAAHCGGGSRRRRGGLGQAKAQRILRHIGIARRQIEIIGIRHRGAM